MSTTVKNSKMARRYEEEFKRQAVELLIHSGKRQRQAAKEFGNYWIGQAIVLAYLARFQID